MPAGRGIVLIKGGQVVAQRAGGQLLGVEALGVGHLHQLHAGIEGVALYGELFGEGGQPVGAAEHLFHLQVLQVPGVHAAVAPADILHVDRTDSPVMQRTDNFCRLCKGGGGHLPAHRENAQQGGFLVHAADQLDIQRDLCRFDLFLGQQAGLLIALPHRPAHAAEGSVLPFEQCIPHRQPSGIHDRLHHRHIGACLRVGEACVDRCGLCHLEGSVNR